MSCDPGTSEAEGVASKRLCSPLLEKEQARVSHDDHVTRDAQQADSDLEVTGGEQAATDRPQRAANLLGLDYSSSEDES